MSLITWDNHRCPVCFSRYRLNATSFVSCAKCGKILQETPKQTSSGVTSVPVGKGEYNTSKEKESSKIAQGAMDKVSWAVYNPDKPYWVALCYPNVKRIRQNGVVLAWVRGAPQQDLDIEIIW